MEFFRQMTSKTIILSLLILLSFKTYSDDHFANILNLVKDNLSPFDFENPYTPSKHEKLYFKYYKLNINNTSHHFGALDIAKHQIATHYYKAPSSVATAVVAHGYFDHSGYTHHLIKYLLERSISVIAIDLPGHGMSSGKRGYIRSFDKYTDIYKELMDQVKTVTKGPYLFFGHSTGCVGAINALLKGIPLGFDQYILFAPLVRSNHWRLSNIGLTILDPFVDSIPRFHRQSSSAPHHLDFIKNDPLQFKSTPKSWIKELIRWNKKIKKLPENEAKIVVFQGLEDAIIDQNYNKHFLETKFPNLEYIEIKKANHHLFNESTPLRNTLLRLLSKQLLPIQSCDLTKMR